MFSISHLLVFAGIVLVAAMAPGPDFLVVMRNSATTGRRIGVVTAVGVALGVFVWATAAALGVAAVLAASATAFTVVKIAGAAYLLYLAVRALWSAWRGDQAPSFGVGRQPIAAAAAFRQGLFTNLLNPKASIFFIALMPQFVSGAHRVTSALWLALVALTVVCAWFSTVANVVGLLRRFFERSAVRRSLDAVTGGLLGVIGIRVALQTQP